MKVAIYCRVSTTDQDTNVQAVTLEKFARSKGYKFTTFHEVESTRKTRPVKQRVLAALRAGEYHGVLVYKLDRWARSSVELITEMKELHDKGKAFISYSDNIDFSTATGKLQVALLAAFAEFERSLISERTRAGLAARKQAGTRLGRPPGSKDKKQRVKGGYYLREMKKRNA